MPQTEQRIIGGRRKERQYATAGDLMDIERLVRSLDAQGANSSTNRSRFYDTDMSALQ